MSIKHRFLLLILLCWPFVSVAVNTSAIQNASTVAEAVSAAKEELSKLNLTEEQRAAGNQELENATQITDCDSSETAEEDFEGGYCPATGNGLKSINDKTMVGDLCSSTNIQVGEVILRKDGKTCTCVASACNSGYYFKGGACYTEGKAVTNLCPRSIHKETKENNTTQKCVAFCGKVADKAGCKYSSVVMRHSTKECICNPNVSEIDAARESMQRAVACPMIAYPETKENNTFDKCSKFCEAKAKENSCKYKQALSQHSSNQCVCNPDESQLKSSNLYKQICAKDRGKRGKNEHCVEDYFDKIQTQIGQAIGFAQEYARIKDGNKIVCSNNHRTYHNDDYIACATNGGSVYYEFKFDDIRESVDSSRRKTEQVALCKLGGGRIIRPSYAGAVSYCDGLNQKQCTSLDELAKRYGHELKWSGDKCGFTDYGQEIKSSKEFEDSLAKIDGLDNYAFYKLQVVSIRKNFVLEDDLKKYVQGKISVATFSCDPGYKTVTKADNLLQKITGDSDDIKRCYVNKKPFDFVFNDLSEIMKYERDAGESGSKCIANNGKFDGHYCRGLIKSECFELEKLLLKELKTKGWNGDEDLVDWDESAGACELNAAQFANNVNKTGKYAAIAGLTVGGVVSGGSTTAVAVGLMATELAGMAGEIYVERKKELLPQQWANEFLVASRSCKSSGCAEITLRSNFGKIAQSSDMLNRDVLKQVDDELARLGELLSEDRLADIMNNPQAPNCWETWKCQERIFVVMQMASLGAAVGKALVKFTKVIAKKAGAAATKKTTALVKTPSKADNVTSVTKGGAKPGPTGGGAGDAAKGADTTSDGVKATNAADDSAHSGSQTKDTDSGAHTSGTNEGSSQRSQNANEGSNRGAGTSGSADAARTANKSDDLSALRQSASRNFDTYLAEAKNNVSGKSDHIIPKARLNDSDWKAINESLAREDVQLVEVTRDGKTYMQFVRKTTKTSGKNADDVADAAHGSAKNAANSANSATKIEKIRIAKEADNLGYHGTDADIAVTDKIRPSGNTSGKLGRVGYGIAKNYDDAERYAIRRLIERQNPGKYIEFDFSDGVFKIRAGEPLNLSNKTGYVYTTAKGSDVQWDTLFFSHSRNIASPAAGMPNAVEILDKVTFNLDDLIRSGKVKIIY